MTVVSLPRSFWQLFVCAHLVELRGSRRAWIHRLPAWLSALVICGVPNWLLAEVPPSAESLLSSCLKTQAFIDHVSMRVVAEEMLEPLDNRPKHQRVEILFRRDHDRLDVTGDHLLLDKLQDRSFRFRQVFDGGRWLSYQYNSLTGSQPKGAIASTDAANRDYCLESLDFGCVLDGVVTGYGHQRLAEHLLKSGTARVLGDESIAGMKCLGVTGTTAYGEVTLWIAPSKGCVCLRALCRKAATDLHWDDKRISELPIMQNLHAGDAMVGWTLSLDGVQVTKVKDTWVPVAGVAEETHLLSKGRNLKNIFHYTRSDVEPDVDFSHQDAFRSDLPEGARITNLDDTKSGIQYQWRNGRVVQSYEELSIPPTSLATASRFPSGFTIVLGLNIALVLVLVTWFAVRQRRKTRD